MWGGRRRGRSPQTIQQRLKRLFLRSAQMRSFAPQITCSDWDGSGLHIQRSHRCGQRPLMLQPNLDIANATMQSALPVLPHPHQDQRKPGDTAPASRRDDPETRHQNDPAAAAQASDAPSAPLVPAGAENPPARGDAEPVPRPRTLPWRHRSSPAGPQREAALAAHRDGATPAPVRSRARGGGAKSRNRTGRDEQLKAIRQQGSQAPVFQKTAVKLQQQQRGARPSTATGKGSARPGQADPTTAHGRLETGPAVKQSRPQLIQKCLQRLMGLSSAAPTRASSKAPGVTAKGR